MNVAALQAGWADLFVEALVASGVTDLIASPGSRSTPFVLAAARASGLRVHVVIDERAAAFVALGMGRKTGAPAALLCTSGTAAANYLPAVVEASLSHTPLVAITADRPPELQQCAAPQTIDQTRLFGTFARGFFDLGAASASPNALLGVRRKAAQAVALSLGPEPGPVHINAPARKPLEDRGELDAEVDALLSAARATPLTRCYAAPRPPAPAAIDDLARAVATARRGVIACGPAPASQREARAAIADLARATGFPLLVEATSQLRLGADIDGACLAFDAALRAPSFRRARTPDLIIELGSAPVSTGWRQYVAEHRDCPRFAIGPHGWRDEHNAATALIAADVGPTCRALVGELDGRRPGPDAATWRAAFLRADERARGALDAVVPDAPLTQSSAARTVVRGLPNGGWLSLGNSLSVRDIDAFCYDSTADVAVLSQRGASGIDGLVAAAAGSAVASGEPGVLLLGDVSFAHDIGGLAATRLASSPLVVVVVDNAGGRIFEQLPVASLPDFGAPLERYWLTPPTIDVSSAAQTYGLTCRRASTAAELASALADGLNTPTCSIVHAVVAADSASRDHRAMHAAAGAERADRARR